MAHSQIRKKKGYTATAYVFLWTSDKNVKLHVDRLWGRSDSWGIFRFVGLIKYTSSDIFQKEIITNKIEQTNLIDLFWHFFAKLPANDLLISLDSGSISPSRHAALAHAPSVLGLADHAAAWSLSLEIS